jgi:hypothetical protein
VAALRSRRVRTVASALPNLQKVQRLIELGVHDVVGLPTAELLDAADRSITGHLIVAPSLPPDSCGDGKVDSFGEAANGRRWATR